MVYYFTFVLYIYKVNTTYNLYFTKNVIVKIALHFIKIYGLIFHLYFVYLQRKYNLSFLFYKNVVIKIYGTIY